MCSSFVVVRLVPRQSKFTWQMVTRSKVASAKETLQTPRVDDDEVRRWRKATKVSSTSNRYDRAYESIGTAVQVKASELVKLAGKMPGAVDGRRVICYAGGGSGRGAYQADSVWGLVSALVLVLLLSVAAAFVTVVVAFFTAVTVYCSTHLRATNGPAYPHETPTDRFFFFLCTFGHGNTSLRQR